MVITDNRNELGSKVPALGEQTSAVTMGKAHGPLFRLMQGNAFDFPGLPSGTKFLRQEPKIDDDSQVMEHTLRVCSMTWESSSIFGSCRRNFVPLGRPGKSKAFPCMRRNKGPWALPIVTADVCSPSAGTLLPSSLRLSVITILRKHQSTTRG